MRDINREAKVFSALQPDRPVKASNDGGLTRWIK